MTLTPELAGEPGLSPAPAGERFRPSRAGVINIWDYVDEEFAFAGGRLALRGHNGSGKTKALEVLFPFVLDGMADSRRLDPFSGENRTMKSNLLYRGQESEYGYVWMEFARSGETVTLIVGLRAHRSRDGVRTSFYVSGRRLGTDFGLLSADSRPLTERQLKAVLEPGAHYRTATEYRDAVDARLFGLGRERYAQLLDLLLALRRPLLAKDLDPEKVSDTLTSGLSPVDEDLVLQAARDFENLAAVQQLFDDLTAANAAVAEFGTHYAAYLRAHVRFRLDRVEARTRALAGQAGQVTAAAAEHGRASAAEREAERARDEAAAEASRLDGRLTGLKRSEEYQAHDRLDALRREVAEGARAVAGERQRLAAGSEHLRRLREEAGRLAGRAAEAMNAATRRAAELDDAARRSGIAADGGGPVDTGADVERTAKARAIARRGDIAEIRRHLEAQAAAEAGRKRAEETASRLERAERERERAAQDADATLEVARRSASGELAAWMDRWRGPVLEAADGEALAGALDRIGEPGAPGLAEVFGGLSADRQAAAITARASLEREVEAAGQRLAGMAAERESIAAERDDAPPLDGQRTARRDGSGAPLWQLVRFADGADPEEAAAIEGALHAAGLLTAWIHPDPELTLAALAAAEPDGYLVAAGEALAGRTLAEVLVPEEQDRVGAAVISAILGSIRLAGDLADAAAAPVVTTRGQYSYGIHAGARPKAVPEYIGATNRASRRRARLEELDRTIAEAEAAAGALAGELERAGRRVADFGAARGELPDTIPIAAAAGAVSTASALLAAARADLEVARADLDTATAEVAARARQLRQAGAERAMPTTGDAVTEVEAAVGDFETAAGRLAAERTRAEQAEGDLADRAETIEAQERQHTAAAETLASRERDAAARAEELATLEATLGESARLVLAQIGETERAIAAARERAGQMESARSRAHDQAVGADKDLAHGRDNLAVSVAELREQAREFGPYTSPELRPLIGVREAAPWPHDSDWPDPAVAGEGLARALIEGAEPGPEQLLDAVLPAGVAGVLDAYQAAARGGRAVTEGSVRNADDRMSAALKEFSEALEKCSEDYRVEWEMAGVVTVSVLDADGRSPVAAFATRIGERVAEQGVLLEDRERSVLEDELLSGLAQQIHGRVIAARDLVRAMNEDTRSKPMSSGIAVGIRWAASDRITERQRAASRLLERDALALGPERLGELRGLLREMIKEYRAGHQRATYREALATVLDYRAWHVFELLLAKPGAEVARLTRARHSVMSGGEKSAAIHLPLFAAANALYSSAKAGCPRMIALDEAFVGIDERYKPDLFGLAVKFDLDLFMTGHDLWVTYPTVPSIAHYDLHHDERTRAVSSLLVLWDGEQLLDAGPGFSGNEELVMELLGFRPTRHAPAGADGAMVYDGDGDDAGDGEDDGEPDGGGD